MINRNPEEGEGIASQESMMLPRIRKKFRNRPDQSNLCFVCTEAARRRSFRRGQTNHGDSFGARTVKCADRNGDRISGDESEDSWRRKPKRSAPYSEERGRNRYRSPCVRMRGNGQRKVRPQLRASRFTKVRDNGTGRMRRRSGNPA